MKPNEIALVAKLRSLRAECRFESLMTFEQRRDIVRKAIDPVLEVTFTIRNGKRITMAMQYADTYGEVP